MTAYIFQQLSQRGKADGVDQSDVADAREWFRDAAQQIRSVNRRRMMNDKQNIKTVLDNKCIGKMYTFFYDPKHKDVLPYYDMFPLIFLVDFRENGFLGINLHYLPPVLRAKLMDSLYQTINNTKYDDTTKLRISYQILASASKYRWFKPCLKHYLWDHVQGNYLNIEPTNWDSALMLPTEQFRKATKDKVWRESREMI
jgi:hypothetical protein